ncbi:MAG: hypothetical protein ACR2RE_04895, partial [Geminicoccaceae bacterium]
EIIVVFRVDPDPGRHQDNENPGDTSNFPQSEKKSLQQRKWGTLAHDRQHDLRRHGNDAAPTLRRKG